jgi:hypothetical protein
MRKKKVVSRNVAIGLGVLCVILLLTLAWITNYHASDNSRIASLQNQVDSLNAIVNLQEYTTWANSITVSQTAGAASMGNYTANYAGYVLVNVLSSTTSNTSVQVTYTSHGLDYGNVVSVGSGGSAIFPILPATITIWVDNTNSLDSAIETVTILYYY